jgi:hypothetical protein
MTANDLHDCVNRHRVRGNEDGFDHSALTGAIRADENNQWAQVGQCAFPDAAETGNVK